MNVKKLLNIIGSDFYTGVPDSQLKSLCDYLMNTYGTDPRHHIIAANEGNCVALAAGYHLATGRIPVVYMQNSGEGNAVNPVTSLINSDVYAIPLIFLIGWRGEPGVHDEPQHRFQGKITLKLLEDVGIEFSVIDAETTCEQVENVMKKYRSLLCAGKSVAFVFKKGALTVDSPARYKNENQLCREDVIRYILRFSKSDPVISTTGKISRELFEIRDSADRGHGCDFLTVGSMGHSSSIALGVALQKPQTKVWCIDGDGAALMHMGAMAVIGAIAPKNLIHVVINNGAHESVGGFPTVASAINFVTIAKGCGYPYAVCVRDFATLEAELKSAKERDSLCMIEVRCSLGARSNLGRPTTTTWENKAEFMRCLNTLL